MRFFERYWWLKTDILYCVFLEWLSYFLEFKEIIILSTCEAVHLKTTSCACHSIWLRWLLEEHNLLQIKGNPICVDKRSAQALAQYSMYHNWSSLHHRMYCQECRSQACEISQSTYEFLLKSLYNLKFFTD